MDRLSKKELKNMFEDLVSIDGGKCTKANPFIYKREKFKCYVFIKNISPAYYINYPDNSRVQLPTSDRFKDVINSNLDFLIIGYDLKNEVFVSWNPSLIKDRLNEKRNVSVYSRFSWQKEVKERKFIHRNLGNNEKVILFKKHFLNKFFQEYKSLFQLKEKRNDSVNKSEFNFDIKKVRSIIDPMLKDHKVLQAATALEKTLKNEPEYSNLTFKNYFEIVNNIYEDLHS